MLLEQLVNGLTVGAVYALIALGYTMVYGILEFINFAHGELFMVGAYLGYAALAWTGGGADAGGLALAFGTAMALTGSLGVLVERAAYRPLRRSGSRLTPLITAIGVSIVLQNAVMLSAGKDYKSYPELFAGSGWGLGGFHISPLKVFIIASSVLLMGGLHLFVTRTKAGAAMRAVAQDPTAAGLMGISVNRVIALTFLLGSSLGAAAGVLVGLNYGTIDFMMGYGAGLKAFTAAVLGGIGNLPGAMAGGLVVGLVEALGGGYISTQYQQALVFGVLILVLTFRPTGLLGARTPR